MSMNNDERLFMMMATIEQSVEQGKQQQAIITAQTEQIKQLAETVKDQLQTIKDLKAENLKSAKDLEATILKNVSNAVDRNVGLSLGQEVRRQVEYGVNASMGDITETAGKARNLYVKSLKEGATVATETTAQLKESLGLRAVLILGGSLLLSFFLTMGLAFWFTPSLDEIKERRAELALTERETGADFKTCDGVACVKVLVEQCNYGQSTIGDKTAYCRLPSSLQRSMGK